MRGCGGSGSRVKRGLFPSDRAALRQARAYGGFSVYSLGDSFEGLPLTGVDIHTVLRENPKLPPPLFTFTYGECIRPGDHPPDADHPCTLPQIQISDTPLCGNATSGLPIPTRRVGAGALVDTTHGVVYSETTVIHMELPGKGDAQLLRAIPALRPVNPSRSRPGLRPPNRTGMRGALACSRLNYPKPGTSPVTR